MKPVTDQALLDELNTGSSYGSPVTDPSLLEELDAPEVYSRGPLGRHGRVEATPANLTTRARAAAERGVPIDLIDTMLQDQLRQRSYKVGDKGPTDNIADTGIPAVDPFAALKGKAGSRARGGHGMGGAPDPGFGDQSMFYGKGTQGIPYRVQPSTTYLSDEQRMQFVPEGAWVQLSDGTVQQRKVSVGDLIFKHMLGGTEQQIGGLVQAMGDALNLRPSSEDPNVQAVLDQIMPKPPVADAGAAVASEGRADSAAASAGVTRPDSLRAAMDDKENALRYHGGTVLESLPAIVAALVTKNPEIGADIAGVSSGAQQYGQDRSEGIDPGKSAQDAILNAALEKITETLPLEMVHAPSSNSLLKALGIVGAESTSEAIAGGSQAIGQDIVLGRPIDTGDVERQTVDSAIAGAGMAGPMATAGVLHDLAAPRDNAGPELAPRMNQNVGSILNLIAELTQPPVKAKPDPLTGAIRQGLQTQQEAPQSTPAPVSAPATDEGSAQAPAQAQDDGLAPRVPVQAQLEPGVTRESLIQEYVTASSDETRAAAAARIAAFEQHQAEEARSGQAENQEGPGQEGAEKGQGDRGVPEQAQADQQGQGPVTGDRAALESPIGQAAQAGVARVQDAPRLVVHSSHDTIPQDIVDRAQASGGIDRGVEGLYDERNDTVHIISAAIDDPARAEWVIDHELSHAMLRSAARRSRLGITRTLEDAATNPTVAKLVQAMAEGRPETGHIATEEAVVELITALQRDGWDHIQTTYGVTVPKNLREGVNGTLAKVVESIRQIINRVLGRNRMTDADIYKLLQRAQAERAVAKRTNSRKEKDDGQLPGRHIASTAAAQRTGAAHAAASDDGTGGAAAPAPDGAGGAGDGNAPAATEPGQRDERAGGASPVGAAGRRAADSQESNPGDLSRTFTAGVRVDPATGERVPADSFKRKADESFDEWEQRVRDLHKNTIVFSRAAPLQSKEFKAWFGESKVVDSDGNPMRVFHGTGGNFEAFSAERIGQNFDDPDGYFFTNNTGHRAALFGTKEKLETRVYEDMTSAGAYAKNAAGKSGGAANVMPVYVSLQNPLVIEQDSDEAGVLSLIESRTRSAGHMVDAAKEAGHDGIIVRDLGTILRGEPETIVIAFEPSQVKSAISNSGAYSRDDDRITFSRAKLLRDLTPGEQAKVTDKVAEKVIAQLKALPPVREMAAVAAAGQAKRGWYADSAKTISDVFGPDAPRFAMLLAALSPQTSVESNLTNALNTWKNWIAAGRPTERDDIVRILGKSVEGNRGEGSVLNAWINNSVRALSSDDPREVIMSGPKVNSFFQNLIGNVEEVTNDAWMANFAAVNQTIFKGNLTKSGNDPGKGTGYLAMNVQTRRTARQLTELTGERWTPAEVQETIWAWAKTITEMGGSAEQIVLDDQLTDELIAATPDFGTLFTQPKYAAILKESGYDRQVEDLAERDAARPAGEEPAARGKAKPFAEEAQKRLERQAARRIDRARRDADVAEVPFSRKPAKNVYGPVQGTDLEGLPTVVPIPGRGRMEFHGFAPAQDIARRFAQRNNQKLPTTYAKVDVSRAERIAEAYAQMKHDPQNPWVKQAYAKMIEETLEQYRAILDTGLKVEFIDGKDPYEATPRMAILDVVENNHLWVFPTNEGFGTTDLDVSDNPLLQDTEFEISGRKATANDIFRAVHDYFGHVSNGVGFRADGEENAWREHSAMYSPLARSAMTSETRGQNSWVNFGPHGAENRSASPTATHYADQKTGLMPAWTMEAGADDAVEPDDHVVASRSFHAKKQQPDAVAVDAIHYSNKEGLKYVDPKMSGTGRIGAAQRRRFGNGQYGKNGGTSARTYFFVRDGSQLPSTAGVVVGAHPYQVRLTNLYDQDADPRGFAKEYGANIDGMEEAISDAGFDGLYSSHIGDGSKGSVAIVFDIGNKKIPVEPVLDDAVVAQRVFHGTPHTVDKFSLQKIGTGEGAQAFGWGLYFAGRKQLADWYRDTLSKRHFGADEAFRKVLYKGHNLAKGPFSRERRAFESMVRQMGQKPVGQNDYAYGTDRDLISHALINMLYDFDDAAAELFKANADPEQWAKLDEDTKVMIARPLRQDELEDMLQVLGQLTLEHPKRGNTYAVDIPENDELLNYDERVGDMPKAVQDSVHAAMADIDQKWLHNRWQTRTRADIREATLDMHGDDIYRMLEQAAENDALMSAAPDAHLRQVSAPEAASHHLYTHGIPGLYFKDRQSRQTRDARKIESDLDQMNRRLAWAEKQPLDHWMESRGIDHLVDRDAAAQRAKDNAIGIIKRDISDLEKELAAAQDVTHNYVIWDEGKISEPEVVFSRGVPLPPPSGVVPLSHALDQAREKLQDRMLRLRRVQEHVGPISDAMDAYTLENMMYGAAKDQLDDVDRDIHRLQNMMKRSGLTPDQLQDYLLARHAPERNAKVASINPALPDAGSGITTQEAQDILAGRIAGPYSNKVLTPDDISKAQAAAQIIDGFTARTLKVLEDSEQITPALAASLRSTYQHYVPLKGSDSEPDWTGNFSGTGKGLGIGRSGIKRALGRGAGNIPDNILGETVAALQRAIVQAEKAKVTQAFLKFAKANPMPDLYTVEPVDMEWKFSKATGQAYLGVKSVLSDADRSIIVPDNGRHVRIRLEDQRLRDAMLHMSVQDFGAFVKYGGMVNRLRSAVLTRFNPAFTPINILRDLQFGLTAILADHGPSIAAQAIRDYVPATAALWRDAGQPTGDASVPDAQKTIDDWAREYNETGVKTGLTQVDDVQDLQARLATASMTLMQLAASGQAGTAAKEALVRAVKPIGEVIERVNDASENALRLSTYIALRRGGMSRLRAGEVAKNLTINFNRKGSLGPILNSIFLFYNASMQGAHATQRLLRHPGVAATLVAMGGLQAMLAASLMHDDDDDGVTTWDMIPDYVKRTSLVVPLGAITGNEADYFALPMPYGFNLFTYAGGRTAQYVEQGARPTDNSFFLDMLKSTTEAFSPIPLFDGYNALFGDTISSLMQLAANKDDFGQPIAANPDRGAYTMPRALTGRPDTARAYQVTAQLLAKAGGADLENRIPPVGFLDVAPEQLEFMTNFLGGGLANIVSKSTRWWEQFDAGNFKRPMDYVTNAPIASRLLGTGNEARAVAQHYAIEQANFARRVDVMKSKIRAGADPQEVIREAAKTEPSLFGLQVDTYKRDAKPSRTMRGGKKGEPKVGNDGTPKFVAGEGTVFNELKDVRKEVQDLNSAIDDVRDLSITNKEVVKMMANFGVYNLGDLGLEDGYTSTAAAPNRVRQRAIKLLQGMRENSEKRFLKSMQKARELAQ